MKWIECDNTNKLPVGEWLVKIDRERDPYHIAVVTKQTADGHKMIIIGNHFDFDMGKLIAYTDFERYEPTKG